MALNNNEFITKHGLLFVIGGIIFIIGLITLSTWLVGIGGFLTVFAFMLYAAKINEEKTQDQDDIDIFNQQYQQYDMEIAKQEEQISDNKIIDNMETEEKNDDTIPNNKLLITRAIFEEMCQQLKEVCDMIKDICREKKFQDYVLGIKTGNDCIDNSQQLYEGMKFFIIQDILRNYERLGHKYYVNSESYHKQKKCSINYNIPEGQLLHGIVIQMMKQDDNQMLSWDDFEFVICNHYQGCQKIRNTAIAALNTYANADVEATTSSGLDDFAFCIVFHNYSKEYENIYRKRMLRIATVIANADNKVTEVENKWLDSIMNVGSDTDGKKEEKNNVKNPSEELNNMIGLSKVKNEINTLCNFIIMKKKREAEGLKSPSISYHCVFTGNPGTGKTTVARLLAGIYKDLGVLKKGHLVETDRSGLVAEYVGQTAVKTNKIIDSALDGVLFIDEAYSLANGGTNDYGPEAIGTLLKRMEDDRERLVVILAGYNKEIESFINSNPGLRSRFNRYIHFEDYTATELFDIFCLLVKNGEYTLTDDASQYLQEKLAAIVAEKPKDFGNARFVRNIFEKAIEAQANRLASMSELSKDELKRITKEDIHCIGTDHSDGSKVVTLNYQSYLEAKQNAEQTQAIEKEIISDNSQSIDEVVYDEDSIEVCYTVFGHDNLDDISVEVDIKERELEWLTEKEEEGEFLDSDFISENRKDLHKRILHAILEDIEYEQDDNDTLIDDDDIEYTINL